VKFLVGIIFFASFGAYSQQKEKAYFPQSISVTSAYQNEDIFISAGLGDCLFNFLEVEVRYGIGSRRTFFQQSLFSKIDLLVYCNLLKTKRVKLGPCIQFTNMSLSQRILKPIQRYNSTEIGYVFTFGNKYKVIQSSFLGLRNTGYVPINKRYSYVGYAFQIGLMYEL
jgi:hypothetical protein